MHHFIIIHVLKNDLPLSVADFIFIFFSRLIEEEGGLIAPKAEGRITMVGNL